jgi:hypothetical protein
VVSVVVIVGDVVDSRWSYGKAPLARHYTRVHVLRTFMNITTQNFIVATQAKRPTDSWIIEFPPILIAPTCSDSPFYITLYLLGTRQCFVIVWS